MGPRSAHAPLAMAPRGYWKRVFADFREAAARMGLPRGSTERRSWSECAKLTACVVLGTYAALTALGTVGENTMTDATRLLNTMNAKMAGTPPRSGRASPPCPRSTAWTGTSATSTAT